MVYECQNFVNGQVLTAECLNRMDEALAGVCDENNHCQETVEELQKAVGDIGNMTVSVKTAEGSDAYVTKSQKDGAIHLEFSIPRGESGDTPVLGEDYWTEEDRSAMSAFVNLRISQEVPKAVDERVGVIENGSY